MKSFKRYISLAIILGLTSAALAQPYSQTWETSNAAGQENVQLADAQYTLGWQDTQKPSAPTISAKAKAAAVEAPVAVNLAELPSLIASARGASVSADNVSVAPGIGLQGSAPGVLSRSAGRLRGPSPIAVPTHNITLHADRYFDHYTDNYRYVNKVEVITYRGGYPQSDTHWNGAQYSTYDVYINNLKPGDRYEVRVTWDDGTYRTLSRNIDRRPERHVRVSEPL